MSLTSKNNEKIGAVNRGTPGCATSAARTVRAAAKRG